MKADNTKKDSSHVHEENVYTHTHWTLFLVAVGILVALFLLIQAGS